eukprot:Sspe_Gene.71164::Locus_42142_Transcript_4_6_Confidence_0.250_Length_1342::g.71164::m.71164
MVLDSAVFDSEVSMFSTSAWDGAALEVIVMGVMAREGGGFFAPASDRTFTAAAIRVMKTTTPTAITTYTHAAVLSSPGASAGVLFSTCFHPVESAEVSDSTSAAACNTLRSLSLSNGGKMGSTRCGTDTLHSMGRSSARAAKACWKLKVKDAEVGRSGGVGAPSSMSCWRELRSEVHSCTPPPAKLDDVCTASNTPPVRRVFTPWLRASRCSNCAHDDPQSPSLSKTILWNPLVGREAGLAAYFGVYDTPTSRATGSSSMASRYLVTRRNLGVPCEGTPRRRSSSWPRHHIEGGVLPSGRMLAPEVKESIHLGYLSTRSERRSEMVEKTRGRSVDPWGGSASSRLGVMRGGEV